MNYVEKAQSLLNSGGGVHGRLLYLSHFGSKLYGTSITNKSDVDIKGIFMPSMESLLLGYPSKHLSFKTSTDSVRNNADDVDLDLWSVHYWLKLLADGDTGAVDLLFSWSHQDCVLFTANAILPILNNPLNVINPSKARAYIGYCIGQAKKYGIKGSRLGIIKRVLHYTKTLQANKLQDVADDILQQFADGTFCKLEVLKDIPYLSICGKLHQYNISLDEFVSRLETEYEMYGERARLAEQNQGIDWKALSHAFRCIVQMKQLLQCGYITFPITEQERELIIKIKCGTLSWEQTEQLIVAGLEDLETMLPTTMFNTKIDQQYVNNYILGLYSA